MTRYIPPRYPWFAGTSPVNLGAGGPRMNAETQVDAPRVWPQPYQVALRGMGTMPVFQIGATVPVFNNQYAGGAPGRNVMLPGLSKGPFGG